jgi:hypothetical protein
MSIFVAFMVNLVPIYIPVHIKSSEHSVHIRLLFKLSLYYFDQEAMASLAFFLKSDVASPFSNMHIVNR